MLTTQQDILTFFRENTFFPNQRETLIQIQEAFKEGKRFIILEAGTGTGKTIISRTTADWSGSAHICTIKKDLQEQYIGYKEPKLPKVSGRGNYDCKYDEHAKRHLQVSLTGTIQPVKIDKCSNGECIKDSEFRCQYKPSKKEKIDEVIEEFYIEEHRPEVKKALIELGLKEDSSITEAKEVFHKLVQIYHPDHGGNAEDFIRLYANFELIQKSTTEIHTTTIFRRPDFACTSATRGDLYWNDTEHCNYWQSKAIAMNAPVVVHNYMYLMYESNFAGDFGTRNLLVCDEGHNIKKILSDFVGFSISIDELKHIYDIIELVDNSNSIEFNNYGEDVSKWMNFLNTCKIFFQKEAPIIEDEIKRIIKELEKPLEKKELEKYKEEEKVFTKLLSTLTDIVIKIDRLWIEYISDPRNWVINLRYKGTILQSIELKPITVGKYAEKYLFRLGQKILTMSATFLDPIKFCKDLDIPLKDVKYINVPSPFDPNRAPIYPLNLGKINNMNFEENIEKVISSIQQIMDIHNDQKGIIHCSSNNIRNLILEKIDEKYKHRLIVPRTGNGHNKQDAIDEHKQSKEPTVLISISDTEGLDLEGDLCRFQYITTLPFSSLNDAQIKKRQELDPESYDEDMLMHLIQASGRGIRNSSDYAFTYIAPSQFSFYITKKFQDMYIIKKIYPNSFAHFKSRIKWNKDGFGRKNI